MTKLMRQPGNEALGVLGNLGETETKSGRRASLGNRDPSSLRFAASMSPLPTSFAPLLYAGRLAEGIEALPKCGFTAVEISLRQAEDLDTIWLDNRLSELGLVISAFATGRMCLEDSLCLTDTNPIVRNQLFERFVGLIRLAARFKASIIIGGVRGKLSGNDQQKSEQRTAAVNTLRHYAEIAGNSGINLLLEPINRYETNFVNSALEGLELIEAIGHSCVKLLLDTFHMNIEETDPCASIRKAGQQLGYIHFADSNRQAPGRGHINFPAILKALVDIDYHGYIAAEILPIPDDATALIHTGQYLHSLMFEKL